NFLTNDEEASGIIDASDILGRGYYLLVDQAHYPIAGSVYEGGQILALYVPNVTTTSYVTMATTTLTGVENGKASAYAVQIASNVLGAPLNVKAPANIMVNNLPMITLPGAGGVVDISANTGAVGTTTFVITVTAVNTDYLFTHTLVTNPRVSTLTGVWTLTGAYLASKPELKIADFTQGTVTGTIYEGGFSGLHYIQGTNGLEYYTLGDRGPNVDANAAATAKLFPQPAYAPKYHKIKLMPDQTISITSSITFKRPGGANVSGLVPPISLGGTGEIALDIPRNTLTGDDWGIDCEGIVEGKMNDLWVCDEYGVNVWRFNKNDGTLINRYSPFGTIIGGNLPLPSSYQFKRANRGFEGVAVTPNGMVYALIQSPMFNPTSAVQSTSRIHRLLQLNPATGEAKTFAYVNDGAKANTRVQDWKLGDLVAVNDNEFLVIEHTDRTPYSKNVYKIDISAATALTVTSGFVNGTATGLTLEQLTNTTGLTANAIVPVSKMLVADLQDYGYDQNLGMDKPEGLTIVDANTIAVTNDNDFQVSSPNTDGNIVMTNKLCFVHQFKLATPLNFVPVTILANPTITFSGTTITVGGASLNLTNLLTSNSTGAKSFMIASGSAASLSGNNLVGVMAGSVTVTGMVATATGFNSGMANAVFTVVTVASVVNVNPTVSFSGATITVGGGSLDLSTLLTSNSTGAISFMIASGSAASLSGNNLVGVMAGSVTITGMVATATGFNSGMANAVFTVVTIAGNTTTTSVPMITVSPSITGIFVSESNATSPVQSLTVSGRNLTGNVTITALGGFEFRSLLTTISGSTITGTNYLTSLEIMVKNGSFDDVWEIRMAATTITGTITGLININTPGVAIEGTLIGTNFITGISNISSKVAHLTVYPNPNNTGVVHFSKAVSFEMYSQTGNVVMFGTNATEINISHLAKGLYLIKTNEKELVKLVIE
ncbi:MAG: esterase-like activity of phytase family protein, partial [Bacteroidota bacterium]|nr:esterase-like activity of phytase family protein [Bacteroidota bacterium]